MTVSESPTALAPGSVLIHAGPPKTGSTALQSALQTARSELATHGVLYPGRGRSHTRALFDLFQWKTSIRKPPKAREWQSLREEIAAHDGVSILSSEHLAFASADELRSLVGALAPRPVAVLMTVRSVGEALPSLWQERIKNGERYPFEEWLRLVLTAPESAPARFYARSQQWSSLLQRWDQAAPEAPLTLVLGDGGERRSLFAAVEHLTGLPEGLLPVPEVFNTSLSVEGVEILRRVNELFAERKETAMPDYRELIRLGMVQELAREEAQQERIRLPEWSRPQIEALSAQTADLVSAHPRATLVGDVAQWREKESAVSYTEAHNNDPRVAIEAALAAAVGTIEASRRLQPAIEQLGGSLPPAPPSEPPSPAPASLADISTRRIIRELASRARLTGRGGRR